MSKQPSSTPPRAQQLIVPTLEALTEAAREAAQRVCSDNPDEEAVHDFRVALRRMRSIVRASRRLYGKRRCRKWEAKLKRFGDATNALRDAEVLADTLKAAELEGDAAKAAERWLAIHRGRQDALQRAAVTMLSSGGYRATLKRLIERVRQPPKRDLALDAYADSSLAQAREDVAALMPVPAGDVERLHRLRIRFKRLRYNAEMLRGNWTPEEARAPLEATLGSTRLDALAVVAKAATKLQKRLGLLHDADQALLALEGESELSKADRRALEKGLLTLRDKLVQRALRGLKELPAEVLP